MAVTIAEIAQIAGVSVSTVSRALSNSDYPLKEETRSRILKLAEEMGYMPNLVARSLRTEQTRTIGIIADNIASTFTHLMIRGIQDNLKQSRYASIIINTERHVETEIQALRDLLGRSIDGVLLVESFLQRDGQMPDLAGKPFVFVHRLFNSGVGNCVMVDERYGTQLALDHLIRLGHRRIAHISGPVSWDAAEERLVTYRETLDKAGLGYDETIVREGDWQLESGYAAAKSLLAMRDRPTAIFAANDAMAIGTIYAIQDAGLRVPEDVALVGYDNLDAAWMIRPNLTTVTMPCYDMGQAAAKFLVNLLDDPSLPDEQIKVRGELIIRESCGARNRQGAAMIQNHYS